MTGRIGKIRWQIFLTGYKISKKTKMHASAHSSPESDLEHLAKVATKSRKHSVHTHLPKDRNCNKCLRTQIIRVPCKRRNEGSTPRTKKFGDLITADHKILIEGCESRVNDPYAVVVQDLATQWTQFDPCKTKSSRESGKSLSKFLEPSHRPKVVYMDNSTELGRTCEDLSWYRRTSTPHRSETNGMAERAVRRVKEGTSAILLQSGLDERWWSNSKEFYCFLRNVQDLLADGRTPCERRFGEPVKRTNNTLWGNG